MLSSSFASGDRSNNLSRTRGRKLPARPPAAVCMCVCVSGERLSPPPQVTDTKATNMWVLKIFNIIKRAERGLEIGTRPFARVHRSRPFVKLSPNSAPSPVSAALRERARPVCPGMVFQHHHSSPGVEGEAKGLAAVQSPSLSEQTGWRGVQEERGRVCIGRTAASPLLSRGTENGGST